MSADQSELGKLQQAVLDAQKAVDAAIAAATTAYNNALSVCAAVTSNPNPPPTSTQVSACESAISAALDAENQVRIAQNTLVDASKAAGAPYHVGIIRSVDALYSDLLPDTMPRPRQLREELDMWSRAGVLSNDMESSTLFVVSRIRKLRAGTINLCVDELGAGEIHHLDPKYMDRMLRVAVDAVKLLIERDRAAEDK